MISAKGLTSVRGRIEPFLECWRRLRAHQEEAAAELWLGALQRADRRIIAGLSPLGRVQEEDWLSASATGPLQRDTTATVIANHFEPAPIDKAGRVGDPRHGRYAAQEIDPFPTGPVESTRGWLSVDYHPGPRTTVRIVTTHLEVGGPGTGAVQDDQARELLAVIAASPYPVINLNGGSQASALGDRTFLVGTAGDDSFAVSG